MNFKVLEFFRCYVRNTKERGTPKLLTQINNYKGIIVFAKIVKFRNKKVLQNFHTDNIYIYTHTHTHTHIQACTHADKETEN